MTPTQKIGRKRSQRTELSRHLPQKAVGVSGVLAAPTQGAGREDGPPAPGRHRSASQRFAPRPGLALAALLPAASHAALSEESFQRTPDRGEPKCLKSAIRAGPEHPPFPGQGVPGWGRGSAPLRPYLFAGRLLSGRLPLSRSEDARWPFSVLHFSSVLSPPSPLPGPCRCPRSLYTCWGSPGWALNVNSRQDSVTSNSPVRGKGGHGEREGGFQVGAERKGRCARKGGWVSAPGGWN